MLVLNRELTPLTEPNPPALPFYNWRSAPLQIIELAEKFGWQMVNKAPQNGAVFGLFEDNKFCLTKDGKTLINVDFTGGATAHRHKFGGGKNQAIAKAAGLNKGATPTVLDATAGMGKDAFVLASLGCHVTLVERQPPVYMMLVDGFRRAIADGTIDWFEQRMQLINKTSHDALQDSISLNQPFDVVYLDPMFPHREKSAAVKKDMALFQSFVGDDADADQLLPLAYQLAQKRVVVKRPDYAPFLNEQTPNSQIKTKKNRFDLYIKAAMV